MSLYTHIERKEDLLEPMMDETVAEVIVDEPLPAGWRTAITLIARRSRESLLGHPWLVELLGRRTSIGPNGLRHAEQSLAALDGLGVDSRSAVAVVMAVDDFTLGHTVREVSGREAARREGLAQEEHPR